MAAWFGLVAPPVAALTITIAGFVTPGYHPATQTISRLAQPGLPAAVAVDAAIFLVACSLLLLAFAAPARLLLAIAGSALMIAALVHLDSTSVLATAGHRLMAGIAMLALTVAPFVIKSRYVSVSRGLGTTMVVLLLIALTLAPSGFTAWGVWERCFLAVAMASVMVMSASLFRTVPAIASGVSKSTAATTVSIDETSSAVAAKVTTAGR